MQISSTTESSTHKIAAKANGKVRTRTKPSAANQTLQVKAKHLVATPAADDIATLIATAAYYRAEQRGFMPGSELEDWLQAEQQVRSRYS